MSSDYDYSDDDGDYYDEDDVMSIDDDGESRVDILGRVLIWWQIQPLLKKRWTSMPSASLTKGSRGVMRSIVPLCPNGTLKGKCARTLTILVEFSASM